jgi:peptidoglycan hydrolase-like amidase
MSQFGANAMAAHYGYTYDQIIGFYYTGVSLSTGVVR